MNEPPLVLFVCVHNAGRSRMAAALLKREARGRVRVRSAGSAPVERVNPVVIEAMAEIGIDLARERPRRLTDADASEADIVVTMGCGDACPVFPGKRYEDWSVPDPAGQPLPSVRLVRDDLSRRVSALLSTFRTSG